MNNTLKILLLSVVGLLILAGCRSANIYNAVDNPINVRTSEDKVFNAIRTAGANLGWQIKKIKPGLAQGQLNLRKHSAIVDIPYSTTSYSINYKSSIELDYDPQTNTIHKNYNSWVQNLRNAIEVQLSLLEN